MNYNVRFIYKETMTEKTLIVKEDSIRDVMDGLYDWGRSEYRVYSDFKGN